MRIYIIALISVLSLALLPACSHESSAEARPDAVPIILNFFETFDRVFGQFYSGNQRWPQSPDELLDLNARLGGPFSPQALRDRKIRLKSKDDKTLIVLFVNSSPPQGLRLYPPNADGNIGKVVVLTSREVESELK